MLTKKEIEDFVDDYGKKAESNCNLSPKFSDTKASFSFAGGFCFALLWTAFTSNIFSNKITVHGALNNPSWIFGLSLVLGIIISAIILLYPSYTTIKTTILDMHYQYLNGLINQFDSNVSDSAKKIEHVLYVAQALGQQKEVGLVISGNTKIPKLYKDFKQMEKYSIDKNSNLYKNKTTELINELNKIYKQTFKIIEPNVSGFVDKLIKSNTSNKDLISVLPQNFRTQYVAQQLNQN